MHQLHLAGAIPDGRQLEGLLLGLETSNHLFGVHARFDDLQGHFAADWLALLGHVDHAEAALADLLEELVAADDRPGPLRLLLEMAELLTQLAVGGEHSLVGDLDLPVAQLLVDTGSGGM